MTIENCKFCLRWSACRGSPRSISLACFKQEEQTKLMYFSFSKDNCSSAAWIADFLSQASLRDVQRQHCWKRGCGDGQRLWDYGTSERSSMPFQLCASPLKGEVRRSPEPSARPLAAGRIAKAANLYDVLIPGQRCIVKRRRSYAFSHCGAHFCLRGGVGGRGRDLTWQHAVKHQSPAARAINGDSCDGTLFGVGTDLCVAICKFSQVVFVTSNNFTHNLLFYFQ